MAIKEKSLTPPPHSNNLASHDQTRTATTKNVPSPLSQNKNRIASATITQKSDAVHNAPPTNTPNINHADFSSNLISITSNVSNNSTKTPTHNLILHGNTRVVIEGYRKDIIKAMLTGYTNNGLCHIMDYDNETEYIVPESTFVRLPNDFNYREPYFERDSKVHAVYPDTDTLYPGVINDNTKVVNNKVAVVFVADDGKDDTQLVPIVDILKDEQVLSTRLFCGLCVNRMYRSKSKPISIAVCIKCKKQKYVHDSCMQKIINLGRGSIKDPSMICDACLSPCFLCGMKHNMQKCKVQLYKCLMCPSDREMWTLLIPPDRFSGKGNTGCLSMMAVDKREKLKPDMYPCNECAVDSLYNFKHGKVFHDGMDDTVQEKLLSAIDSHLIYGTATETNVYMDRAELHDAINMHFLHLKKN